MPIISFEQPSLSQSSFTARNGRGKTVISVHTGLITWSRSGNVPYQWIDDWTTKETVRRRWLFHCKRTQCHDREVIVDRARNSVSRAGSVEYRFSLRPCSPSSLEWTPVGRIGGFLPNNPPSLPLLSRRKRCLLYFLRAGVVWKVVESEPSWMGFDILSHPVAHCLSRLMSSNWLQAYQK